ncbi:hypothetical protein ACQP1W_36480 [Spirillospora sp. CA-255316]
MRDGADGYLVVGRNDRPLPELYVLRPFLPAVAGHRARGDGWQVWELGADAAVADSVALLVDLVAATRAPALLGSVLDAGHAAVEGFSGASGYWQALVPAAPGAAADAVEEVAGRAAGWAAAACRAVAPDPIAEFLRKPPHIRADGMVEELLSLLGLPDAAEAAPEGSAVRDGSTPERARTSG